MSGKVTTFSMVNSSFHFGLHIVKGYAPGSAVTFTPSKTDVWNTTIGPDGEKTRVLSGPVDGVFKIILQQGSTSNGVFSRALAGDIALPGSGLRAILWKDHLGNDFITAAQGFVKGMAVVEYGDEPKAREWSIETGAVNMYIGGAKPPIPTVE